MTAAKYILQLYDGTANEKEGVKTATTKAVAVAAKCIPIEYFSFVYSRRESGVHLDKS